MQNPLSNPFGTVIWLPGACRHKRIYTHLYPACDLTSDKQLKMEGSIPSCYHISFHVEKSDTVFRDLYSLFCTVAETGWEKLLSMTLKGVWPMLKRNF